MFTTDISQRVATSATYVTSEGIKPITTQILNSIKVVFVILVA